MVPPTGASDSILVMRQNGASLEPYYGALAPQLKNYSMDANDNRIRKSWGERWKVNKSGKPPIESQMIETSNFMVHPDYLHKYGTLSNGVLTKSIKYAETWLYGTVGVRGAPTQRPSLFLYPGVVAPPPRIVNQSNYLTSPGPFLTVPAPSYPASERNTYIVSQPRKHADHRFTSKQNEFKVYQCTDCGKDIRPGASMCKKCGEKRTGSCRSITNKSRSSLGDAVQTREKKKTSVSTSDPYNLMRKSRLGVGEVTEPSIFSRELSQKKIRNAAASPLRRPNREATSPSFETFKPKQPEKDVKTWENSEEDWINGEEEVIRRKSILECDVNAYELNKSRNKLRDVDDSSDEFSEGMSTVDSKLKISRPKLNKTEARTSGKSESQEKKTQNENLQKSEVRLNGQRFKIFDHSNPSTAVAEGYVSDDDDCKKAKPTAIPRLSSPKRPPRKPKDKVFGELSFKYSKSKSKSSPNLSIKSILKKPTGDDCSLLDFGPQYNEAQSTSAALELEKPMRQPDQHTKHQNQNTLKKKKQVQFRVNNSYESLNKTGQLSSDFGNKSTGSEVFEGENPNRAKETGAAGEPVHRSKSCENLSLVTKITNEFIDGNEIKIEETECDDDRKEFAQNGERDLHFEEDSLNQGSMLKRSFSDRRPSSAIVLYKDDLFSVSTSPPNSYLFNDTMALRTRATRLDTREVFINEKEELESNFRIASKEKSKVLSPPPLSSSDAKESEKPSPKTSGNIISYTEFSKITDAPMPNKETTIKKTVSKKSKTSPSSNIPVKVKAPAPSPPPRQSGSARAVKSKNPGAITVRVSSEEHKNQTAGSAESTSKVCEKVESEIKIVESREPKVARSTSTVETDTSDGRTVVRLSPFQDTSKPERAASDGRRASITIHPKNILEEPKSQPQRKSSILINNFHTQDSNKVTISVRNDPTEDEPNSSTCTIIETGSNSTVIPVMSTDNKTTLIVGSNTPVASPSVVEDNPLTFPPTSQQDQSPKPEKPSQYIFSTVNSETDKSIEFMDPVEAVRRNLIPHICGKEDNGLTLMEKIKQSREIKEQKNLKQISQLFAKSPTAEENVLMAQPPESLLASYKNKKANWKNLPVGCKFEGDSSTTTSRSNSFCSTLNSSIKNSSTNTSRSNSFRSNCYKSLESDYDTQGLPLPTAGSKFYVLSDAEETSGQERDKLEYEYEIRNGFKDEKKEDSENIYETIKEEPIYDQVGLKASTDESEDDIPPPLPLTLPPSLDEIDKRSAKSIFEGASKYDILNYLVDAKERVQEESYFSGSSTSEDTESRKLSSFEESKRASLDSGIPCQMMSSSDGLEGEENLGIERCASTSTENDSGVDLCGTIRNLSSDRYSSEDNLILPATPEKESMKLTRKSSAEIERNDSGVGSETSHTSRSKWQVSSSIREDPQHLCEDCDQAVETQVTDGGVMYAPLVCRKCSKRRSERKEIIQEIVETEEKYGRDLKIILEEFYTPMLVAGLLMPDQLSAIFLNTEELLENSEQLTEKLRDTLEIASEQGDEDLLTVNVGKLFLEAGPMLHAFESYCTRQGAAAVLLANLEKEKELLRIFLRVSQMENTVLRRMNLNSFLMVPVQRVTKYPLLLARLYKVTPVQQEGRELLKEAQHNIELHLEHMNSEAKDVSATKVWRRFSTSTVSGRKSNAELEMINIKLRKMAIDVLEWNHEEVRFVMEGKLLYTQPTDNNWKRGRTIKLTPIFVLLVTLGKPNSKYKMDPPEDELTFPTKTGVREATLLLVKEKCGRYTLIREPLYLDKIIVCCETDLDEYFEIQELSTKDSFIFKAEDGERTKEWYKHLQYHAQILGSWRRRRNALANIMINGMMARAYTS